MVMTTLLGSWMRVSKPNAYDSITQQDLLDFIRDNIRPERMALSIIYPKE